MNHDTLQLLLHGAIVLLIGLLSGIPYGYAVTRNKDEKTAFAWRVAHSGLSMGGTMMIAMSAALAVAKFDSVINVLVVWPSIVSGYSFAVALPYGAWVGHRGLTPKKPARNMVVYVGNIVGAISSLLSALALIGGCWIALMSGR
jgi:hypothetical protein